MATVYMALLRTAFIGRIKAFTEQWLSETSAL